MGKRHLIVATGQARSPPLNAADLTRRLEEHFAANLVKRQADRAPAEDRGRPPEQRTRSAGRQGQAQRASSTSAWMQENSPDAPLRPIPQPALRPRAGAEGSGVAQPVT